jgi:hypothetical protein
MPVPYKGGIPFGATLGAAGAAASTAGDSLIKARLEEAQALQAQQTAAYTQARRGLLGDLPSALAGAYGDSGQGAAAGTGASGKSLTGPAKIIADSKGTVFDTGDPFLNLVAHHESGFRPNIGWGDTDLSGYKLNANGFPDWPGKPGPQGNSTAAGLFQITGTNWNKYAPPLIAAGVMKPDFSPESQIAVAKSMMTANGKSDWLPYNPALAAAYNRGDVVKVPGSAASPQTASTGDQPPPADLGPQTASGGAYSVPPPPGPPPKPGEYAIPVRAGNVPPPPAAPAPAGPPMAQPAAPRGLLDTSQGPLGSSAAPPQLATPPAASAPGPVTGLLGQQPAQQVAAADAPQLSPAAAAILHGINRQQAGGGLLASGSVAGDNAVPTGGPSPAAVAQAGPPHTGAAGAAELAGLLAQQPAAAPPTATPYTNAPPVNGQGAPAPSPAPPMSGGVTPPAVVPPMPSSVPSQIPQQPVPIPGAPTASQVANARRAIAILNANGMPVDPALAEISKFPLIGPAAAAGAAATLPYDIAKAVAPQTERGIQTRITEGDKVINVPGLGWVQQKNIPGYTIAQNQTNSLVPTVGGVPGTTYAANGGNNPQTGTALFPSQTDAQKQFLTHNIESATKELDGYHTELQTAPAQVAQAQAINQLMGRTQMGWGADTRQEAAMILQGMGVSRENIQQLLGTDPTAGAALNKLFLKFSADAVRTMGAREPGSVIGLFAKAYPNLETDPDAARLMTSALQMDAQWKVDRAKAADRWAAAAQQNAGAFGENYHGMQGFGEAFLNQANPHTYWQAGAAMAAANATTAQGATDMRGIAWQGAKPGSAEEKRVYDLIPAGTRFRASDGNIYTKPGQ